MRHLMLHPRQLSRGLAALLLIAAVAMIAGCTRKPATDAPEGETAGGDTGTETTATADAPSSDEPIQVGVILPLSGDLKSYGSSTMDGISLAVQQVNQNGGINGRPLRLVVEDNKGDATQSATAYSKLATLKKVSAVIGPITSNNTKAVAVATNKDKVCIISPTATNDTLTSMSDYVFRTCFKDSFQGEVVANYAYNDLGLKKAAVYVQSGNDYSTGLGASFTATFTSLGGEVVTEQTYSKGDTEFGPALSKIADSGAELVFVPGYPPDVQLILKQAKIKGVDALFCGSDGWDNDQIITNSGDKIVGCFFVSGYSPEDQRPMVQDFITAIKGVIPAGKEPGFFEAQGYDTVMVLAEALKTGSSPAEVRQGLLAVKDLEAVTSSISILPNGDADKKAVVMEVTKDGDTYSKKYVKSVAGSSN